MNTPAIQDLYPDAFSHCHGCGRLAVDGMRIKTYWKNGEGVCTFFPRPDHVGIPGFAYGGLIASLIDCHSTATAAAAHHDSLGKTHGKEQYERFVTGKLTIDFLKPTPIAGPIDLRSTVTVTGGRRITVTTELSVRGLVCARGEVTAVLIPDTMRRGGANG